MSRVRKCMILGVAGIAMVAMLAMTSQSEACFLFHHLHGASHGGSHGACYGGSHGSVGAVIVDTGSYGGSVGDASYGGDVRVRGRIKVRGRIRVHGTVGGCY